MQDAKAYIRSVVINDDIYIFGGYESNPFGYLAVVNIIETANNDWVDYDSVMGYELSSVSAVIAESRIYIMGMLK